MIGITMQTALLIYSVCFLIGFLFTTYYFIVVEYQRRDFIYFILFNVLASIGSMLIYYRENLDTFMSIMVSNTLLFFAYIHLSIGIRKIIGLNTVKYFYTILTILYLSLFTYFTYVDFQVLARVHIYNGAIIILIIHAIYSLIVTEMKGKEIMTYVLVLLALSIFIRSVNLLINTETVNAFLSFEYDAFYIVVMGLANLLVLSGLLSLINYQREIRLVESERSKTSLLSNLPGFAYRCLNDEFWTMKFLSQGFKDVTGYDNEEVLENKVISFEEIILPEFREQVRQTWNQVIKNKDRYVAEYIIKTKNEEEIWILEQGIGIYDDEGTCVAIEGFISDIDTRKSMEGNLEFLSYRDYLTGLYNRRFIEEQIIRLDLSRNLPISVIMGDINGLKFINDSFGHDHGDKFIKRVASILKSSLRGYELISRLGGDEYLVILENTDCESIKVIVDRILVAVKADEYSKMGLSVSFGYATKTSEEQQLSEILKESENMMYREKLYQKPSSRRKTVDAVLATLFEKDVESERHSRNVARYSKRLAKAAGLSVSEVQKTATAGLLHDVGKIIIDASILKSTTKLTEKEYDEIKKHTEIGYRILYNVVELRDVANIILCHHERPDGKGYPNNLKDKDIPYISKIISICDAFDAMIDKRRYKDNMSLPEAFEELRQHSGTQFDKKLVDVFIKEMTKKKKG